MKKLPILLFLALGGFFASCEKDSSEPETPEVMVEQSSLVGTWDVTGYEVEDGKSTTEAAGQSITQEYTSYGKDYDMTVDFNENPQTAVSNGSYISVLTYSLLGQKYTQEVPTFSLFEESEWQLEGSDIVFTANGKETRAKVTEMSETKLIMLMDYNEVLEADGGTVTTTGKLTITLER